MGGHMLLIPCVCVCVCVCVDAHTHTHTHSGIKGKGGRLSAPITGGQCYQLLKELWSRSWLALGGGGGGGW